MTQPSEASRDQAGLHCKEIRGGIEPADESFSVPGIEGWVYAQPYRSAEGGDIHFVGLCGHGMLSRFIVADVAGHGDRVAREAQQLRAIMADHMDNPDQSELVTQMNRELAMNSSSGQFATALVISYLAPLHHVVTVNAGHPRPLLRRGTPGQWELLDKDYPDQARGLLDLPLGVLDETGYRQFAIGLKPDDLIVLYSDSLIEACDEDGTRLGQEGLLKIAAELENIRPRQVVRCLRQRVIEYQSGRALEDDITLIVLRHTGRDPEVIYDDQGNQRPFDPKEFRPD